MFFTTIEEWIGLVIAMPFCVLCGYISVWMFLNKLDKKGNDCE